MPFRSAGLGVAQSVHPLVTIAFDLVYCCLNNLIVCEQPLLSTFDHQLELFQINPQKNIQPSLHINHALPLFSSSDDDTADKDEEANVPNEIEVETVVPFRDSDSEQLRSVSDLDMFSSSDEEESTSLAALAFAHVRGRGRAIVWVGHIDSSSDDDHTLPYNWLSGWGRSRGRAAASVSWTANLPGRTRSRGRETGFVESPQPGVGPFS